MRAKRIEISQAELKELLNYDAETGVFTRQVEKGRKVTGSFHKGDGYIYIQVTIDGKTHRHPAHRLAWLYANGYDLEHEIDHINRIKTDNRIVNLREVSHICNLRNAKQHVDNTSGVRGVGRKDKGGRWYAQITVNYKTCHLGYFKDLDEAVCHRLAAEQSLDWGGCDAMTPAKCFVNNLKSPCVS